MQMGSDPHVILEKLECYFKSPDFVDPFTTHMLCDKQFLLNVRNLIDRHVTLQDENYHLHGQMERVKAGYIYSIVHKYQFGDVSKYAPKPMECTCGFAFWPKKIDNGTKVILSCPNIKCGYGLDVPEKFIEQAKQEMEGGGLEWF